MSGVIERQASELRPCAESSARVVRHSPLDTKTMRKPVRMSVAISEALVSRKISFYGGFGVNTRQEYSVVINTLVPTSTYLYLYLYLYRYCWDRDSSSSEALLSMYYMTVLSGSCLTFL